MSNPDQKYSLIHAVLAEVLLIGIGLSIYTLFPFFQFYFLGPNDFGIQEQSPLIENGVFYLAIIYLAIIPPMFLKYKKEGRTPKSLKVVQKLSTNTFDKEFWFCLRVFVLKFMFIPLMCLGAIYFGEIAVTFSFSLREADTSVWTFVYWINHYVFPVFINTVMTIVLVIYSFGYCVESDLFNNRIKSVDDSVIGWLVTIVCYVPFYPLLFYVIPMGAQDFAFFKNQEITAVVRIILMIIVGLKAWSIATLGARSSNLTNRGIVEHGPYRWVRHPHYLTKVTVFWIGVIPSLIHNYWLIGGMIFWTTIYVLRALSEEQHLKKDPAYVSYMKKVKWRFIPGVF